MGPSGPHVVFTSCAGDISQKSPGHEGPADTITWPSGRLRKSFLPTRWATSNSRLLPDGHASDQNEGCQAPRGPQVDPKGLPRRAGFRRQLASPPLQALSQSRAPAGGGERSGCRSAQLQAQGTRIHLHVRGSPNSTSTAAPKPRPKPSDHLTDPQQEHAPGRGGSWAVSRERARWYLLPLSCVSLPAPTLIARLPPEGGSLGRGVAGPTRVPAPGRSASPLGRRAFRACVKPPSSSGPSQVDERGPE